MKVYYDKDADMNLLKGKKVAVIGYGSQGFAHSNNLKESGIDVMVGLRKGSKSWEKAAGAELKVVEPAEAAKGADISMILVPDELQGGMYKKDIEANIKKGAYLAFAHGFNIHFGQIVPREDVNVFMAAPKSPGHLVRSQYVKGEGVPGLIAVHQNPSGNAKDVALAELRRVQQVEQRAFLRMVGAGRIAEAVARAAILLMEEIGDARRIVARDAEKFARLLVGQFGERFGRLHRKAVQIEILGEVAAVEALLRLHAGLAADGDNRKPNHVAPARVERLKEVGDGEPAALRLARMVSSLSTDSSCSLTRLRVSSISGMRTFSRALARRSIRRYSRMSRSRSAANAPAVTIPGRSATKAARQASASGEGSIAGGAVPASAANSASRKSGTARNSVREKRGAVGGSAGTG